MGETECNIRIGTSGWHYGHWSGPFYPADLPKDKWLEYYAQYLDTVEINNTFYQLPREETFRNWRKQAPAGFLLDTSLTLSGSKTLRKCLTGFLS